MPKKKIKIDLDFLDEKKQDNPTPQKEKASEPQSQSSFIDVEKKPVKSSKTPYIILGLVVFSIIFSAITSSKPTSNSTYSNNSNNGYNNYTPTIETNDKKPPTPKMVSVTESEIFLEWDKDSSTKSYMLKYGKTSVAKSSTITTYDYISEKTDSTSMKISGLESNTDYYFALVTFNNNDVESSVYGDELMVKTEIKPIVLPLVNNTQTNTSSDNGPEYIKQDVNLRETAGVSGKKIKILYAGDTVAVYSKKLIGNEYWYEVEAGNGAYGWINYLAFEEKAQEVVNNNESVQDNPQGADNGPTDCGFGGSYNDILKECLCSAGFGKNNYGKCVAISCGEGGSFNDTLNECLCRSGYGKDSSGICISKSCGIGGSFNDSLNECLCKSGYGKGTDGKCMYINCGMGSYNDSLNECLCRSGHGKGSDGICY